MKILTFYFHLRHIYDISLLGHNLDVWHTDSTPRIDWIDGASWLLGIPMPGNIKFVNVPDGNYDFAIIGTVEELELVKKIYPELPCLLLVGRGISGREEIFNYSDQLVAVVGCSYINMENSPHLNTRVILRPVFPERSKQYNTTLNIPMILSVINNLFYRTDIELGLMHKVLRKEDVTLAHIWVGIDNHVLPNGIGQVSEELLMTLYGNLRLLLYWPEPKYGGFGNTVLEAMTMGMPVALNCFADWPNLIENGVNGFCSPNTIETREFCERCLKDKEYALKVGAAGRDLVMEHFKLDRYLEQWHSLIGEIV